MKSQKKPVGVNAAGRSPARIFAPLLLAGLVALSACNTKQVFTHGAIITQDQIDLIPVGSSRDQVLLSVGSPSTIGNFGSEVYYYITQRMERQFAYQKSRTVDQRVLAVYFDDTASVVNVANYGLQDGRVFDFISRTTPTGGKDLTFLQQLLTANSKGSSPINPITPSSGRPGRVL